jgi:predicted DCC family thiol-disulfide oxidoreductase YuxK
MKTPRVIRAPRFLRPLLVAAALALASLLLPATAHAMPDAAWVERQLMRVFLPVILWMLLAWAVTRPNFFRRAVGEATPGALGAIRALVFGRLLFMVLGEDLSTLATIPESLRRPMGVIEVFFALPLGLDHLVRSATALNVLQVTAAVLLFLATIGWKTRVTTPVGGLAAFLIAGLLRTYSFFWHQDLIALYVAGVLCLTPCGDGFSLDRLIAVARGRPWRDRSPVLYGWARYACWTALALPYTAAGLSKLRNGGINWWNGTTMRRALLTDTLNPMQFAWTLSLDLAYLPERVFTFLGLTAVGGEVFYGLVLLFPWARMVFPVIMGMMHIGIVFLQNILFMDLILLQTIFYDFTKVRKWIGARLNARLGRLEVLFDGDCMLCRRTVEIMRRLDLFERLTFTDFRHQPVPGLSPEALARDMHVVRGGQAYRGFDAYRRIALVLPLGWLVAPLLWLPGMASIGPRVYARVAAGRAAPLACDEHCRIPDAVAPAPPAPRASLPAPFAVAALASLLLSNWVYQFEFFPLTALQMYSSPVWGSREPIVFYRVLARLESGDASKEAWDDVVGPYARNARYRGFLWNFYRDSRQEQRLRRFMTAVGDAYNRQVPTGQRVRQLEAQAWDSEWGDPRAGRLRHRLVVEFPLEPTESLARH